MDLLSLHLRLSDLNELVSEVIDQAFPGPVWVIAEVASVSSAGVSGHTYLELVEKRDDAVVAQARANLWRSQRYVLGDFERVTKRRIERGMRILLLAQPTFHMRYGYGLQIHDIDPNFTLGEMAKRKQEAIDRLTDEGLLDRNSGLKLSPVPQRIAVVSSATAAGWEDFQRRLQSNSHGYTFVVMLYPALVQGDGAELSMLKALREIGGVASSFDCVVLLRGGGGTVDLSCFDGFDLARAIAEFPLPVLCGIGHERDSSVCDLAAYHSAATPTAAAEFLIAKVRDFEDELDDLASAVMSSARERIAIEADAVQQAACWIIAAGQKRVRRELDTLHELASRGSYAVKSSTARRISELIGLETRVQLLPGIQLREAAIEIASVSRNIGIGTDRLMERAATELSLLDREIQSRDPVEILRLGYSITRVDGKVLKDTHQAAAGTCIETTLNDGRIISIVKEVEVTE